MADHTKPRTWRGLALLVAMVVLLATSCRSTGGADASSQSGGGSGGTGGAQAAAPAAPSNSASTSKSSEKLCGTPPCVRYLSRGDTKTLADTLNDHPLASTIAVHIALSVLCGGILCLLGEGVSMPFVEKKAREAANQHACLKVSILPDKDKFSLMNMTASNDSPNCKN
ncbi:MAG: hypothetical protein HOV87_06410 [Catenulispora sp.]|nr:hypothetical protein [Catenulispora sp.]